MDSSCDDFTDPAVQFAKGVFPINRMFRFDEWEAANRAFWDRSELAMRRSEALNLVNASRDGIVNSFGGYIFPVVMLERSICPDRICRIYENLNSSEMRLATLGDLDEPGSQRKAASTELMGLLALWPELERHSWLSATRLASRKNSPDEKIDSEESQVAGHAGGLRCLIPGSDGYPP